MGTLLFAEERPRAHDKVLLDHLSSGNQRLVRFNADGSVDSSFTAFRSSSSAFISMNSGIGLSEDGSITIGAMSGTSHWIISRFDADGNPLASFAANGSSNLNLSALNPNADPWQAGGLILTSDGGVLLDANIDSANIIEKLTSTGSPDPSFGDNGQVIDDNSYDGLSPTLSLSTDGSPIVASSQSVQSVLSQFVPDGGRALHVGIIPIAPSGLVATISTPVQVDLTWNDASTIATGYIVSYTADGINWTALSEVSSHTLNEAVTGLIPGAVYTFKVTADNGGFHADSQPVTATGIFGGLNAGQLFLRVDPGVSAFFLRRTPSGMAVYRNSDGSGVPAYSFSGAVNNVTVNASGVSGKLEWNGPALLQQLIVNGGQLTVFEPNNVSIPLSIGFGHISGQARLRFGDQAGPLWEIAGPAIDLKSVDDSGSLEINSGETLLENGVSGNGNIVVNGGELDNQGVATLGNGGLTIGADGGVINDAGATLNLSGDVTLDGWFTNDGTSTFQGDVTSHNDISSSGTLNFEKNFASTGSSGIDIGGSLHVGKNLSANGDLNNSGGQVQIGGDVSVGRNLNTSPSIPFPSGPIGPSSFFVGGSVVAGNDINNSGAFTAGGDVSAGNDLNNSGSVLWSGVEEGSGTMTIAGNVSCGDGVYNGRDTYGGTLDVNDPSTLTIGGTLTVPTLLPNNERGLFDSSGTVIVGSHPKSGSGYFTDQISSISIGAQGRLLVGAGARQVLATQSLSIENLGTAKEGQLDLADNALIEQYSIADPFENLQQWLKSGRSGGDWNGPGITSSVVANDPRRRILAGFDTGNPSVPPVSSFDGQSLSSNNVIVYEMTLQVTVSDVADATNTLSLSSVSDSQNASSSYVAGDSYGGCNIDLHLDSLDAYVGNDILWRVVQSDGTITFSGTFGQQDSIVQISPTNPSFGETVEIGFDFLGSGVLGVAMLQQAVVPTRVVFNSEADTAFPELAGYDVVNGVKWVMVPVAQPKGTNGVSAFVIPANAVNQIKFVSTVPAEAVIDQVGAPVVNVQNNIAAETVIIRGVKKGQNGSVEAHIINGNAPGGVAAGALDTVKVDVKDQKTITVAVFSVAEQGQGVAANGVPVPDEPNQNQLQDMLTKAFTRQAAINIDLRFIPAIQNLNWGGGAQGSINNPAGANGPGQYNALVNSAQIQQVQADYKIIFVTAIVPRAVNPVAGDVESLGFNVQNSNIAIVATYSAQGLNVLGAATTCFTAAHELGHALGLDHNPANNYLMTATMANNPNLWWRLDKDEWDKINP